MAAFHGSLAREINQRCKPDRKGRLHSIIKNTAAWCVDELWKRMEPLIFEIDPPKKQGLCLEECEALGLVDWEWQAVDAQSERRVSDVKILSRCF